ncbi:hypothetical protein DdX_11226 [Ditylenchus destructor]|uniref:Uncharacterized protein n=1 Tax=Ditylenchus destructor TaxID=166010 RepID=A0AAD4N2H7_9BILA|nr:hypothetical protein DdX_11226 [Ditylenchus destructor]
MAIFGRSVGVFPLKFEPQPPDTDWNQPFKALIRREYEQWINRSDQPQTKGGNQKPADVDTYLDWKEDAAIPEESIGQ